MNSLKNECAATVQETPSPYTSAMQSLSLDLTTTGELVSAIKSRLSRAMSAVPQDAAPAHDKRPEANCEIVEGVLRRVDEVTDINTRLNAILDRLEL